MAITTKDVRIFKENFEKYMKNNKKFQHYKKLSSTKVGLWCFLLFGIGSLLLGILVNSQINFKSYENYEVSGIVENFNKGEKILKIYQEDQILH